MHYTMTRHILRHPLPTNQTNPALDLDWALDKYETTLCVSYQVIIAWSCTHSLWGLFDPPPDLLIYHGTPWALRKIHLVYLRVAPSYQTNTATSGPNGPPLPGPEPARGEGQGSLSNVDVRICVFRIDCIVLWNRKLTTYQWESWCLPRIAIEGPIACLQVAFIIYIIHERPCALPISCTPRQVPTISGYIYMYISQYRW
jgi:hypothetical protein